MLRTIFWCKVTKKEHPSQDFQETRKTFPKQHPAKERLFYFERKKAIIMSVDVISKTDFLITNKDNTIFSFRYPSEGNVELKLDFF